MKHIILSFLTLLILSTQNVAARYPATLKEASDSLDYYIANREKYFKPHTELIDSLTAAQFRTKNPDEKIKIYKSLGDNYRAINIDSAIVYYGRVLAMAKELPRQDSIAANILLKVRLRRDALLPIRGITYEALVDFGKIPLDSLTRRKDRQAYFQGAVDLFTNVSSLYPPGEIKDKYIALTTQYIDSLLTYQRPNGLAYRFTNVHRWKMTGENSDAVAELMDTIAVLESDPALLATATSLLARYYSQIPSKEDESLYYQTISAINDIKSGHREMTSMQRLGKEWFKRGDIERAYRYLSLAMGEAVASGSSARVLESSQSLPLIAESFREYDRRHNRVMMSLVIILIISLIIILVMTAFLRRDHRKSEDLRRHLTELNSSKDYYIQNVLMLCSVFFERLDEFNRFVGRKIKANQVKDLYESIESRKYLATQTEEFFKSFDATFRTIHPNFAHQLNSILRPDKQLPEPAPGEPMTPEMRIAAFMRLGIDDSTILAKFLGLSLNTIYTYRNRLKNRAKNRETFEQDIKQVGF